MSAPQPPRNDQGATTGTRAGSPGTVGVYDRPESADKPSMLPKIITAAIVVAMLVLTYLFWPKSTAPSTRDAAPPATTSAPADATSGSTAPSGVAAGGTGAAPGNGSGGTGTGTGTTGASTSK